MGILVLASLGVALGVAHGEEATDGAPHEVPGAGEGVTPEATTLGEGASPGSARGPGGFVPRGTQRNFYAGAGGRLWYYMNNYYWVDPGLVSDGLVSDGLWIKAEVSEAFVDLRRWPDGTAVKSPPEKTTLEYWSVGPTGRTVWLDNHKDYVLLADRYTAGAIVVKVTLTLGHLEVCDERGTWGRPGEPYVLESRNYRREQGIGAGRTRFRPLPDQATTLWTYRVPWSLHPERLTRSNWQRLALPEWTLVERRAPAALAPAVPAVTPSTTDASGS